MAWITPPVFVALQTLTDSVMNQLSSRLSDLWVGTTAGDTDYYSASDTKSRLGIGTAGQVLQTNAGGTAPEWSWPALPLVSVSDASATVSINTASATPVDWDTEDSDVYGWHNPSVNIDRLTVDFTGWIVPFFSGSWAPSAGGTVRDINIYVDGAASDPVLKVARTPDVNHNGNCIVSGIPIYITTGSYLTAVVYQDSGGALLFAQGQFGFLRIS